MSTEEIIKKAIEKAKSQGYRGWGLEIKDWGKEEQANVLMLIFSHDFAKAFWSDNIWHYQLKKMVLEENPPSFLEKFL